MAAAFAAAYGAGSTLFGGLDKWLNPAKSDALKALEADNKKSLEHFKADQDAKVKAAVEADKQQVASASDAAAKLGNFKRDKYTLPFVRPIEERIGQQLNSPEELTSQLVSAEETRRSACQSGKAKRRLARRVAKA